ncbi:uncharacterized protein A1O5_11892 [Cladophialophora psammophila CBS 110553]|uniref:Rhodanese domain-containing protein n=1 Tax=Cladophialophora psammophila CBS 110553 TaxID=1182543 RepID=W9WSQ0_9EURO|nr:uncharacterized protein A1O5_11892 [Cladophialophora psammophila CBS 110553]EXJ61334.1 hypothetical protein A1O5_11892 [Cladophialophora psammophila CBS 110553]
MLIPQVRLRGQELLLASKVLIIGLGGLGSPAALYLAGAGTGILGLMDGDNVETSNLHRQIVHTDFAARLGQSKVHSAAARCRELNPEIAYVCHEESASASNILDIVSQYDLVLDCTDNPATRYLISDACVVLGKVLVSGAAQRGEGMLIVLNSPPTSSSDGDEKGPCYRCVFPRPPAPETVQGCSEIGILGPVVGVIGTLMAGETIKIITSRGHLPRETTAEQHVNSTGASLETEREKRQHTMLLYNTYASDPRSMFRTIGLRGRRKDCITCGDDETLATKGLSKVTAEIISHGRLDYQAFCGVFEDIKLLGEDKRIHARDFLQKHAGAEEQDESGKQKTKPIVVDVREEHEYELGPKVRGSLNIPISQILRHGNRAFDVLGFGPGPESAPEMGPDGGMVDQESHIPVATRHDSFPLKPGGQSDQIPPSPARETEENAGEEPKYPSIYFVCQRGNDSQIAAQKLMERIEAEAAMEQETARKRKWGWIGDVKGGFLAMERHARTGV